MLKISSKAACTYLELSNLRTEFCYLRCIFLHKPLRQVSSLSFSACGELTCAQHFFFADYGFFSASFILIII